MMHSDETPRFLSAAALERLLDYPGCIAAMKTAMRDAFESGIEQPLRTIMTIGEGLLFGIMPGAMTQGGGYGAKLTSVATDAGRPGHARHQGLVVCFDPRDGAVACMGDGETITRIRTASMSAAATDVLARTDARTLAIYGTGIQAYAHACAIRHVRPIEHIFIWGRSDTAADALAGQLTEALSIPAKAMSDPRAMAGEADVICTVTGARDPVLMGSWVKGGTHINAVGSSHLGPREIDDDLVARSRFIADDRRAVLAAGAEFAHARASGLVGDRHIAAEIGAVFAGFADGRTSRDEVTVFKSLGQAVQGVAALSYAYRKWSADG